MQQVADWLAKLGLGQSKSREFRDREDGVPRAVRAAGGLAGLPSRDSAALENYAALTRHWQAAALASIDKRDLGLCLGAALCLGVAAGLIVSTMENASFEPYFVGLFVAIAVCSRVFLKETEGTEGKEAYPDPRQTPPARRTNGMYQPGESGNPHDRPISAPDPFSQPFISDLAAAWELHGETALARTAVEYPDRFVAICSHLLPRDVMLAIEHGVPGGLDPADFAILQAIKAAIPDANSRAPADVLNYVCEAIQTHGAKLIES